MANERLRALLLERRVTTAKLAEAVQVDAKTVERWVIAGRVPYRKHRYNVAAFLAWTSHSSGQTLSTTTR